MNKTKDKLVSGVVGLASVTSLLVLGTIFYFVFTNGYSLLSWDLLTKEYYPKHVIASLSDTEETMEFSIDSFQEDVYTSTRYGIVVQEGTDLAGDRVIRVVDVLDGSPFLRLYNQDNQEETTIQAGDILSRISYVNQPSSLTSRGAKQMVLDMDNPEYEIYEVSFSSEGGGIAGSLKTTLILIGLTLILALPIGILSAIYFNEFARKNKVTQLLHRFIETLTGVPSIIFGLLGISVFVPLTVRLTPASGSNLLAGALTLSVILLPTIIRVSEESLKVVSDDHRFASLALGANKTQTTFKVVLPQAVSGILTATFLSIGRIIGESAALIFVLGTAVKDRVSMWEPSTSLAVHIWSIMSDEPPNIALASSIALLILIIVLILNVLIKLFVVYSRKRGNV